MKYTLPHNQPLWRYPMPKECENPPLSTTEHALPERYGNRKVPKMLGDINALRAAIRSEGTPAIQDAWDRVEEFLDFLPQEVAKHG